MSDYSIRKFYQQIAQKVPLLLPYQFLITFVPGEPALKDLVKWDELQLLCQAAQIPQSVINTQDVNYFGKRFVVPTTQQGQHTWTTRLILTNEMTAYHELRKLMLRFSSLENNMGGVRTVPNLDIEVDVLNQFSEDVNADHTHQPRIILKGVFPSNLDGSTFQYGENANIMNPTVVFTYQYAHFDMLHRKDLTDSLKAGNVANIK